MTDYLKQVSDARYIARVMRARSMTPEERMLEGVRMYDRLQERIKTQLKREMPEASQMEFDRELTERLQMLDIKAVPAPLIEPASPSSHSLKA